jgi:hypothetical protein
VPRLRSGTDRIVQAGVPIPGQERFQLPEDPTDDSGALVDQRGVELE